METLIEDLQQAQDAIALLKQVERQLSAYGAQRVQELEGLMGRALDEALHWAGVLAFEEKGADE